MGEIITYRANDGSRQVELWARLTQIVLTEENKQQMEKMIHGVFNSLANEWNSKRGGAIREHAFGLIAISIGIRLSTNYMKWIELQCTHMHYMFVLRVQFRLLMRCYSVCTYTRRANNSITN